MNVSQSESQHDVIDPDPKIAGPLTCIDRHRLHIRALIVFLAFSQGVHEIDTVSPLGYVGIACAVHLSDVGGRTHQELESCRPNQEIDDESTPHDGSNSDARTSLPTHTNAIKRTTNDGQDSNAHAK